MLTGNSSKLHYNVSFNFNEFLMFKRANKYKGSRILQVSISIVPGLVAIRNGHTRNCTGEN